MDTAQPHTEGFCSGITAAQCKDTGMAMTLICLLIGYFAGVHQAYVAAMPVLLITMICPGILKPLARVWFGFSHLLGSIMSRVVLSVIFFTVVTPVGFLRRVCGADPLQLRQWKKDRGSVLRQRTHLFTSEDIKHPY